MEPEGVKERLGAFFNPPLFPVPIDGLSDRTSFHDWGCDAPLDLGDGLIVRAAQLNHPGRVSGFRVEWAGRSIAYLTDFEMGDAASDRAALALAREASLAVIDANYTDAELGERRGWGHSSWRQATQFAREASVRLPFLFHHDPAHDDQTLEAMEQEAKIILPTIQAAREGMVVDL